MPAKQLIRRVSGRHAEAARAAVLPLLHTTRYVAGWTNVPTSVASPFTVSTVDVSAEVVGSIIGGGSYFCAVSRDPLNAIIEYMPNPAALVWYYDAWFSCAPSEYDAPTIKKHARVTTQPSRLPVVYLLDRYTGDPTKFHPHGEVTFAKSPVNDLAWKAVWFDKDNAVRFETFLDTDPPVTAFSVCLRIVIYRWDGSDFVEVYVTEETVAASFRDHQICDSGWYAFALQIIKPQTGTPPDQTLVAMGVASHNNLAYSIGHRPIPGILDRTTLTGIRVNGASVMLTPDSAELAKGGLVVGAQLATAYQPEAFLQNVSGGKATDTLINLKGATQMDFGKGMYGWHRSNTSDSYEMLTPVRFNMDYSLQAPDGSLSNKSVGSYVSFMDPADGWLAIAVSTPPTILGGNVTFPGGFMHTTWAWSVEYCSNDVWVGSRMPPLGASQYDAVMEMLARCPQFTSNAFHISALTRWIRSNLHEVGRDVGHFVRHFGPDFRKAIEVFLVGVERAAHLAETL